MRLTRSTVLAACLILILSGLTAGAAGPASIPDAAYRQPPSQSEAPTIHIYSRETVVDVTVTDANGQPVHNLKQSDFTLKEDGKPQPIRSFREFGNATLVSRTPAPKLPPNVYTNLQPPPASSAVNVLLLDLVNTAPDIPMGIPGYPADLAIHTEMQHFMKQEVTRYLKEMPAGTRVALLGMASPGTLRVVQGATSDPALLTAAVNSLELAADPIGKGDKIAMTLESLNQIASMATQIKGRKNLIWFTYGLAQMTEPEVCKCDIRPFLMAFNNLTTAQVAVYPIGVRGVYIGGMFATGTEMLSMESMAEAGNGVAYYNSNDLKTGIAKAVEAGSNYYTLSYVPPDKEYDGRRHSISLKLNEPRPGLHLSYRTYYYAEDPAKMLPPTNLTLLDSPPASPPGGSNAAIRMAMSRNMPTSTELLFDVRVTPASEAARSSDPPVMGALDPKLKAKPLARYDLLYALPVSQIAFVPGPDGTHSGSLEFDITAFNAEGKLINSLSQSMTFPLTDDEYRQFLKSPFKFFQQLDLPPGQVFLRIGIRDGVSNKIGTMEIPVTVPKGPPQRASAQPTSSQSK